MLNLVLVSIIIICSVVIIYIILRRFPEVANIDISTIPEEKAIQIKNRILADRLTRKTLKHINSITRILVPIWKFFQTRFRAIYQKVFELEKKYRSKYRPLLSQEELNKNIEELLKKASEFVEKQEYASAERQYIEILSLDKKNYKAYKGLSNVYIYQKDYDRAIEVLEYIIKLNIKRLSKLERINTPVMIELKEKIKKDLAEDYISLGMVYRNLDKLDLCFDYFSKAVDLMPNHPRYLDLLLDVSIILGKKVFAMDVFNKLKKVNPTNNKLDQFSERIKVL